MELKIKGISITEKANMDKLKEGTENFQEEMVKETDLLKLNGVIKPEGNKLQVGSVTLIEGQETVLDSIKLDPLFLENVDSDEYQ